MRKRILGTAIAAAAIAAAAAGSASAPPAGAAQPPAPAPAPDLGPLNAMTAALASTPHKIVMSTPGSSTTGAVDPAHHAARAVATTAEFEIDEVVSGGMVDVKANLGTETNGQLGITPTVWMKLDTSKLSPDNALLIQPDGTDLVDLAGIENGMTSLHAVDARHLTGTIDLTQVTGHTVPNPQEVLQAGTPATRAPFRVTADAQGRISEFTVDTSSFDPALGLDVRYSDYGAPEQVVLPGSSAPAPASIYQIFGS